MKKQPLKQDDQILQQLLQIGNALQGIQEKDLLPDAPPSPKSWSNIFSEGAGRLGLQQDRETVSDAIARNIGGIYDMAAAPLPDFVRNNLAAGGAQVLGSAGEGAQFLGRQFDAPSLVDAGTSMQETGSRLQQANTPKDQNILGEVIQQVPFMASTLIPGLGVGGVAGRLGLAGAKALGAGAKVASKIGSVAGATGTGLTQATIEAIMETGNKSNEWLKDNPGDIAGANEVGRKTLAGNIGLLTASDTAQAMLMFKRFRKGFDTVRELITKSPTVAKLMSVPGAQAGMRIAGSMLMETNEEAQQTNIGNWAQGKETNIMPWNWTPEQQHEAAVAGLTAGLIGGGAHLANQILPSKQEPVDVPVAERVIPVSQVESNRPIEELKEASVNIDTLPEAPESPMNKNVGFINNYMANDLDAINLSRELLGQPKINSQEEIASVIPEIAKQADNDPLQTVLKFMLSQPEKQMKIIARERLGQLGVPVEKDASILDIAKATTKMFKEKLPAEKFNVGEIQSRLSQKWTKTTQMIKKEEAEKKALEKLQAEAAQEQAEAAQEPAPIIQPKQAKPLSAVQQKAMAGLKPLKPSTKFVDEGEEEKQSRSPNITPDGKPIYRQPNIGSKTSPKPIPKYTEQELKNIEERLNKEGENIPSLKAEKKSAPRIFKPEPPEQIKPQIENKDESLATKILNVDRALKRTMKEGRFTSVSLIDKVEDEKLKEYIIQKNKGIPEKFSGELKFYGKPVSKNGYIRKTLTNLGGFVFVDKKDLIGDVPKGAIQHKGKDGIDYVVFPTHAISGEGIKKTSFTKSVINESKGTMSQENTDIIQEILEEMKESEGAFGSVSENTQGTRTGKDKGGFLVEQKKIDITVNKDGSLSGRAADVVNNYIQKNKERIVETFEDNNDAAAEIIKMKKMILDAIKEYNKPGTRFFKSIKPVAGLYENLLQDIPKNKVDTAINAMVERITYRQKNKDELKNMKDIYFLKKENDKIITKYGREFDMPKTKEEYNDILDKIDNDYLQSIINFYNKKYEIKQFAYRRRETAEYKNDLPALLSVLDEAIYNSIKTYNEAVSKYQKRKTFTEWIKGDGGYKSLNRIFQDLLGKKDRRFYTLKRLMSDFEKKHGRKPNFRNEKDVKYFYSLFSPSDIKAGFTRYRNVDARPITKSFMRNLLSEAKKKGKTKEELATALENFGTTVYQDKDGNIYLKEDLYPKISFGKALERLNMFSEEKNVSSLEQEMERNDTGVESKENEDVSQAIEAPTEPQMTFAAAEARADRKREKKMKVPYGQNLLYADAKKAFDQLKNKDIQFGIVNNIWHAWDKNGNIYHLRHSFDGPVAISGAFDEKTELKIWDNLDDFGVVVEDTKYSRSSPRNISVDSIDIKKYSGTERYIVSLAKILGIKEVGVYEGNPGENGYYSKGKVYINSKSDKSLHWVLSHELVHHLQTMKTQAGTNLYQMIASTIRVNPLQIRDYINNNIPQDKMKYIYLDEEGRERLKKGSYDEIKEEMIADEIANQMQNPAFWRKVEVKRPGLVRKIFDHIMDFLNSLVGRNKKFFEKQDSFLIADYQAGTRSQVDQVIDGVADVLLALNGTKTLRESVAQMKDKTKFTKLINKGDWTKEEKQFMKEKYSELMSSPETNPSSFLWLANRIHETNLTTTEKLRHLFEGLSGKDKFNVYTGYSGDKVSLLEYILGSPFYRALKSPRFKKYYDIFKNTEVMLKRRLDVHMDTLNDIYRKLPKQMRNTLDEVRLMYDERHREHFQAQQISDNEWVVLNPEDRRVAVKHWKNEAGTEYSSISREVLEFNFPEFDFDKKRTYFSMEEVKTIITAKEGWRASFFTKEFTNEQGEIEKASNLFATQDKTSKKRMDEESAKKEAMGKTRDYLEKTYNKDIADAYLSLREHYNNLAKEANIARKRFGLPPLGWIDGYIPHMFSRYAVMKNVDGKNEVLKYFESLSEASSWVKQTQPLEQHKNIIITANSFTTKTKEATPYMFNEDFLTDAEQEEFSKIINQRDILDSFMKGTKGEGTFAERYWAQSKKRWSNTDGWLKDLELVDRRYTEGLIRWTYLNNMNIEISNQYNEDFNDNITNATTDLEKKWIQDIFHEMNGKPTLVEQSLMSWLNRPDNIKIKTTLEHFLGPRPFQSGANIINEATAVSKLGMFNLSSIFLQTTQLGNTYAIVGGNHFATGLKQTKELLKVTGKDFTKIKELYESYKEKTSKGIAPSAVEEYANIIYESKVDVDVSIDGDEIYSHREKKMHIKTLEDFKNASFGQKLRSFGQTSMYAFRKMDQMTRMVSVLAGYSKAKADFPKLSKVELYKKAEDVNTMANFQYGKYDTPRALQFLGPVGQILFQFKKYMFKEIQFISHIAPNINPLSPKFYDSENWRRPEFKRFMLSQMALAGIGGLPFMQVMNTLASVFGWEPEKEFKKYLFTNMPNDGIGRALTLQMLYGSFASIPDFFSKESGADLSKRLGTSDIIPNNLSSLFLGPTLSTIAQFFRGIKENRGNLATVTPELVGTIAPLPGGLLRAMAGEERSITDKQRITQKYGPADIAARILGMRPLSVALDSDKVSVLKAMQEERVSDREKYLVSAVRLVSKGEPLTPEIVEGLRKYKITPKMIGEELKKQNQEKLVRVEKNLPKDLRTTQAVKSIAEF